MRDSLQRVTTSVNGGSSTTTVNSTTFSLPTKGLGFHHPMMMEINYPSDPTGTTPSVIADIYHSADDSTYTLLERVHDVDAADGDGSYPKTRRRYFTTRKPYIRVRYTLAVNDNNYGSVEAALSFGSSLGHREV